MSEFVVAFFRANGRVCLVRGGSTDGGAWDLPSTETEGEPDEAVQKLRREWFPGGEATLVRAGEPVAIEGSRLHPFLFDVADGGVTEHETRWIHPPDLRDEAPSGRWRTYRAIAPTVESVRGDGTHGSAYLSLRALEVLRDRASEGAHWSALVEFASDLLAARPSMAALGNRTNRAICAASGDESPEALERAARTEIDRAVDADDRAATRAAEFVEGTVLTLSRSGTVREALLSGDPDRVVVLESRPDREGIGVATDLVEAFAGEVAVTVTLDAAVAHVMPAVDAVLVGADTVLADGSVVNKVGTRTAAVAAAREGVPVRAVAATDKISTATDPILESVDRTAITDDDRLDVDCPLFDRTPPELVDGVITEEGVLDGEGIERLAAEHARRARWKEPNGSTE
ncbi:MAG: initiation factor 2B-like protein [Halalkalicoccus sp.]